MTDLKRENLIISSTAMPGALDGDEHDDADVLADATGFELRQAVVPVASHGQRLDLALVQVVPEFSRSYLQQLIDSGGVQYNGRVQTKSSAKVKAGDRLIIELMPTPQSQAFKPEAMALDVVYEDAHLLVVNKPAGLVVHPAPGNWSGTLLNGLLARDTQACLMPRAGIVHRLDKDTSGLMVVARTRQVMDRLVEMIAARTVNRQYIALAHTVWQGARTHQVDLPVGRDVKNRLRMAVVDLAKNPGKTATTTITLLENGEQCCLVRCKLHTGRTHQIRVHMAAIGHALLADELYGGMSAGGLQRQALHACELAFEHPVTGESLRFKSPVPADIRAGMVQMGLSYNQNSQS
ncbi:MAG: RluA family pseudouridine synthase [Polaromonas sp.]|nr:RluA family pseudouridine synthase [Polaromonas sp.]